MGSDDLFHKRKARSAKQLERKQARRDSYDRVLIVCEGAKTEPHYLKEVIDYYQLNSANVEVDGRCGSAPSSIVAYAQQRYITEKNKNDPFDKVYCVFDRDSHTTYKTALRDIAQLSPRDVFQAITSVPCFEYWLLLHYVFTQQPFYAVGKKSGCDQLITELKKYLPDYAKGNTGIYKQIMQQTPQAIAYSERILQQAKQIHSNNPSTMMHLLIQYLQGLAESSKK